MHEPTYQQALSKSWQLAWKHKSIWGIGLLAAIIGQFGLGDFFGRLIFLYNQGGVSAIPIYFIQNYSLLAYGGMSWVNILGIIWLSGLMIALGIAVIFIVVTAQGTLVAYIASYFKNSKYNNLSKSWHKAVGHFWQLLAVNILYKLIFCALILSSAVVIKVWDMVNSSLSQVVLGVVLGLLLFLYLIFSIIYIYVVSYIVVDNQKLKLAAKKAWLLFDRHVLVSIEIGIIMILLNLILILAIATSLLLAFLPSVIIWIIAGFLGMTKLAIFGFTIGLLIWVIMVLIIVAVFNVFNTATWVYLFSKMHKEGVISRLVHHVGKMFRMKR